MLFPSLEVDCVISATFNCVSGAFFEHSSSYVVEAHVKPLYLCDKNRKYSIVMHIAPPLLLILEVLGLNPRQEPGCLD
jgi:hypothetical protein